MTAPRPAKPRTRRPLAAPDSIGLPVAMFIVWLALEYGRPPNPMKVPLLISVAFIAGWAFSPTKRWNPQIVLMMLFVGQMALSIPFAENAFSATMVTREVGVAVLAIAIPIAHFIDTSHRFEVVARVWTAIFVYMAVIALQNGGNGPGGAAHGVDENYTALFMTIAIAFAFFGALTVKNVALKAALYAAIALFVAAIVLGSSRGGFVGLVGVAAYCWWKSPGRIVSLLGAVVAIGIFLFFVPSSYLDEVRTIGDTSEGTADARLKLWGLAVRMWLDHPILGVGPGNFIWEMNAYKTVAEQSIGTAMHVTHSLYFELLSEMGSTGVLMWFGILYFNWRDARWVTRLSRRVDARVGRTARGKLDPRQRTQLQHVRNAQAWSNALVASLIGFLLCSLFLSTLYYTTFWLLTAMTVALREATALEARMLSQSLATPAAVAEQPATVPVLAPTRRPAALSGLLGR